MKKKIYVWQSGWGEYFITDKQMDDCVLIKQGSSVKKAEARVRRTGECPLYDADIFHLSEAASIPDAWERYADRIVTL